MVATELANLDLMLPDLNELAAAPFDVEQLPPLWAFRQLQDQWERDRGDSEHYWHMTHSEERRMGEVNPYKYVPSQNRTYRPLEENEHQIWLFMMKPVKYPFWSKAPFPEGTDPGRLITHQPAMRAVKRDKLAELLAVQPEWRPFYATSVASGLMSWDPAWYGMCKLLGRTNDYKMATMVLHRDYPEVNRRVLMHWYEGSTYDLIKYNQYSKEKVKVEVAIVQQVYEAVEAGEHDEWRDEIDAVPDDAFKFAVPF